MGVFIGSPVFSPEALFKVLRENLKDEMKMSRRPKRKTNGSLTSLLQHLPINPMKVKDYGRSNKLDVDELYKLAITYETLAKEDKLEGMNVFHVACSVSKPDIVEHLVKEGWDVNFSSDIVIGPIRTSLESGNIDAARKLIELGADIKTFHEHGCTPMESALNCTKREKVCVNAVKLLLKAGVSVDDPVTEDLSLRAIHIAVEKNYPMVVSCLLQNGANINIQDNNGFTALHFAVVKKHFEIIKLLILHGPDFYKQTVVGDTPFSLAVSENYKPAMNLFVQKGYDINKVFKQVSGVPLHKAVHLLNKEMVIYLLGLGANVNLAVGNELTALHIVADKNLLKPSLIIEKKCLQERKEMLELLVANGADVNLKNCTSPLAFSIKCGSVAIAKLFLKLGSNPNVKYDGNFIFFDVVGLNHEIMVNFLEHGADYTVKTEKGMTPYHCAIGKRVDVQYIKSFVKHGCPFDQNKVIWEDLSRISNYGTEMFFKSEIQYFKGLMENNINVVKKAVESGAIVSSCSENMKYPLHFLAIKGYKELLNYLLEKKFPPNQLNDDGESALHIAAKHGHYDICCSLLRFGASYKCTSKKCSSTPKELAVTHNNKDIVKLLQRVGRIFYLAGQRDHRVITVLESKHSSNMNEYLMYFNAVNQRGDTILATALHKNNRVNAKLMMNLRLQHDL